MRISLKIDPQVKKDGTQSIMFEVINGKYGSSRFIRKRISTKIRVFKAQFDDGNFRAEKRHPNQKELNRAIDKLKDRLRTSLINYEDDVWTLDQVILTLKGEVSYNSVDEYIETEIKKYKSDSTYLDYHYTLKAFKKHLNRTDLISFRELTNYNLLDQFVRNMKLDNKSPNTINSYLTKIRAIINDAYDRGVVHQKFELKKKLRQPKRRTKVETATPEMLLDAINKIENIYDWQSIAFYLLMFCTRGMYPADIVKISIEEKTIKKESDIIERMHFDGDRTMLKKEIASKKSYLVHTRSKTSDRSNDEMWIRLKSIIIHLIAMLKWSVVYTHFKNKPQVVGELDDLYSIFSYDVDNDNRLHKNVWDTYQKRIKKLLGLSFKTARKTFNTYALELEISDTIRRVMLGHVDQSMLAHYDNLETLEMRKQVDGAHDKVLSSFDIYKLYDKLEDKFYAVRPDNFAVVMCGVYGESMVFRF